MAERPVVDLEVDAHIEGSLAAESSLIVLDTMELLTQTIEARESLHSTLGRVRKPQSLKQFYSYKEHHYLLVHMYSIYMYLKIR